MTVRAIRGATQLDRDERDHLRERTIELVSAVLAANRLSTDDLISILFTSTPDLTSEFPAAAARSLGLGDVPLMGAVEVDVHGAPQKIIRMMMHADMDVPRAEVKHVYLHGAVGLRRDLAQ